MQSRFSHLTQQSCGEDGVCYVDAEAGDDLNVGTSAAPIRSYEKACRMSQHGIRHFRFRKNQTHFAEQVHGPLLVETAIAYPEDEEGHARIQPVGPLPFLSVNELAISEWLDALGEELGFVFGAVKRALEAGQQALPFVGVKRGAVLQGFCLLQPISNRFGGLRSI